MFGWNAVLAPLIPNIIAMISLNRFGALQGCKTVRPASKTAARSLFYFQPVNVTQKSIEELY